MRNQEGEERLREWNQTNVDSESLHWWERDRCRAIGKRKRRQRGWGLEKLALLLLWPPSPLLTGPLEIFQRALLYLIKASQAPGSAPRPAIFLHFLQTQARIWKKKGRIKEAGTQNWKRELQSTLVIGFSQNTLYVECDGRRRTWSSVPSFYGRQRNSCACPCGSTQDVSTVLYGSSAKLSAEALVNNSEMRSLSGFSETLQEAILVTVIQR